MTRCFWLISILLLLASGALSAAPGSLARTMPSGALVYLETEDFHALLDRMDSSPGLKAWYASPGYSRFLETKLARKLRSRIEQMEQLIGAGVDRASISAVAGHESALALYDIGKLHFLYLTRIGNDAFSASVLAGLRGQFDERSEGGFTYFARERDDGGLAMVFTFKDNLLALSTRVDLLQQSLGLSVAPEAGESLARDEDFERLLQAGSWKCDLRLHLDQARLNRSGYFRNYWIHRNGEDLKRIQAVQAGLLFTPRACVDRRVLLLQEAAEGSSIPASGSTSDTGSLEERLPRNLAHRHFEADPGTLKVVHALMDEVVDPGGLSQDRAALTSALEGVLKKVRLQSLSRLLRLPQPNLALPYAASERAVVIGLQVGEGAVAQELEDLLTPWTTRNLLGRDSHRELSFESRDRLRSLSLPFSGGRGYHLVQGSGWVGLATHEGLARDLARQLEEERPPRSGASFPGELLESRFTNLLDGNARFRWLLDRAVPATDGDGRYFREAWIGLLDSFSSVTGIAEWTSGEGSLLRQTLRYQYGKTGE